MVVAVVGTVLAGVPPIAVVASATWSGHVATPDVAGPGPLKFVVSKCSVACTSTDAWPALAITPKESAGDRNVPEGSGPGTSTSTTSPATVTVAGTGIELMLADCVMTIEPSSTVPPLIR